MSSEKNKKLAVEILEHIAAMTISQEHVTSDFHAWAMLSGNMEKDVWLSAIAIKRNIQAGNTKFTVRGITAEGDRVAVEVTGHSPLHGGDAYTNVYHFLFTFRDGKLSAVREYMDTRYVVQKLGPLIPRIRERAAALGDKIEFPVY